MRTIPHTNVAVFVYTEVNRVRDAMINGSGSNQRLVNQVLPAVTNLDFVSWSAYDGQDLPASELTRTLNYIESQLSTNKSAAIPGKRVFVGEYGWGGSLSSTAQEPRTRAYVQRLLEWGTPFVLFWEIYNNEAGKSFWLIDSSGRRTPCYDFHQRFANRARLEVARFRQDHARVPNDAEFSALLSPILDAPLPEPVPMTVANGLALQLESNSARMEGVVEPGIYGDEAARVWLHWGRTDGATNEAAWDHSVDLGTNQRFGPSTFSSVISGLDPTLQYAFRFRAVQARRESWATNTVSFQTGRTAPSIRAAIDRSGRLVLQWRDTSGSIPVGPLWIQAAERMDEPIPWQTVFTTNSTAMPILLSDPGITSLGRSFFRILIGP